MDGNKLRVQSSVRKITIVRRTQQFGLKGLDTSWTLGDLLKNIENYEAR